MAKIYRNLIRKSIMTIDEVPERYKESTLAELKKVGLDGYGNPIEEVM